MSIKDKINKRRNTTAPNNEFDMGMGDVSNEDIYNGNSAMSIIDNYNESATGIPSLDNTNIAKPPAITRAYTEEEKAEIGPPAGMGGVPEPVVQEKPSDFDVVVGDTLPSDKEIKESGGDDEEESGLRKALREYNDELAKAQLAYTQERDSIKQRKMWADIVSGVATIAAAYYGLKTGKDLSGVQFQPADATAYLKEASDQLNNDMKVAYTRYGIKKDISDDERMRASARSKKMLSEAKAKDKIKEQADKLRQKKETAIRQQFDAANKEMLGLIEKQRTGKEPMEDEQLKNQIISRYESMAFKNGIPFDKDNASKIYDSWAKKPGVIFGNLWKSDTSPDERAGMINNLTTAMLSSGGGDSAPSETVRVKDKQTGEVKTIYKSALPKYQQYINSGRVEIMP